jgi:hypothetical protein
MTRILRRQSLFKLALVTAILITPAARAEPTIDGFQLKQNQRLGGDVDLSVCPSALKITFSKSGLSLIARAPWKEAFLVCKPTGRVYKTNFDQVASPYLGAMALFDGGTNQVKTIPSKTEEMVGIKCQVFVDPPGQEKRLRELFHKGDVTGRAPGKLKYIVTRQLNTPPQIGSALARFYALPDTQGIPLEFSSLTVSGDKNEELKTFSCKAAKFKQSDFALPTGLKSVRDARLVLVPDKGNEENGMDLMMMSRSGVK